MPDIFFQDDDGNYQKIASLKTLTVVAGADLVCPGGDLAKCVLTGEMTISEVLDDFAQK